MHDNTARPGPPAGAHGGDWIRQGALAHDHRRHRTGRIMAIGIQLGDRTVGDGIWLRPVGGGVEWEAEAGDLQPAQ